LLTKRKILGAAVIFQIAGYLALIFLIVGNEVLDIPHAVFGSPETPTNRAEVLLETAIIVVLGTVSIAISIRHIRRIRFLEGFLPVCSVCRKIRSGEDWMTLEEYMNEHSEALLSHSLCPGCAEVMLGDGENDE